MRNFKALAVLFFVAFQVRGGNADDEELMETMLGLVDPLDSEPAINEFWWPDAESEFQSSGEHEESDFLDSMLSDAQMTLPDSMGSAMQGMHSAFADSMAVESQLPMSEYDDEEDETTKPVMETETETDTVTVTVPVTAPTVTVTITDSSTSPTTKTSHTTSSSTSTSSSRSTVSSASSASSTSTTPTPATVDPGAATTTTTTTTTTTGVVEGSVQFEVSGDNVSAADIVESYTNDPTGPYGEAFARAVANASQEVGWQDVMITGVEVVVQNTTRRLESHLRSERMLTAAANAGILVQYEIQVSGTMGIDTVALADALGSEAAVTAIEAALTTELQQVDPSLTVSAVVVETVAIVPSTVTTTAEPSFAHGSVNWRTALLLGGGIATLFMLQH